MWEPEIKTIFPMKIYNNERIFQIEQKRRKKTLCIHCKHTWECKGMWKGYTTNLKMRKPLFLSADKQLQFDSELCGLYINEEIKEANIAIRTRCINNCNFCATRIINSEHGNGLAWKIDSLESVLHTIDVCAKKLGKGKKKIRLTAIEPSEQPDILEIIQYANDIGFDEIEMWTHGRRFRSLDFAKRNIESGVTSLGISLLGHISEIHDSITKSHDTVEGLYNLVNL